MLRSTTTVLLMTLILKVMARGRYEFIEEQDLPAFYSMRSAQMAQKAQMTPQMTIQQDPYGQIWPYQMYQPVEVPQGYPPFPVYNPVFRAPTPTAPAFQAARPAPVQYHPMYYQQTGQPQIPPLQRNSRS